MDNQKIQIVEVPINELRAGWGKLMDWKEKKSMKDEKTKELFLEQLRKTPIIHIGCSKAGIARSTAYRWRDEDEEFRKAFEAALLEGEALINDMSESQLLSLIRDQHWPAISFWLKHRNPKFRERIDINANIQTLQEKLTPEQEEVVKEALRLGSILSEKQSDQKPEEIKN